jgi:hypothetical protein
LAQLAVSGSAGVRRRAQAALGREQQVAAVVCGQLLPRLEPGSSDAVQ